MLFKSEINRILQVTLMGAALSLLPGCGTETAAGTSTVEESAPENDDNLAEPDNTSPGSNDEPGADVSDSPADTNSGDNADQNADDTVTDEASEDTADDNADGAADETNNDNTGDNTDDNTDDNADGAADETNNDNTDDNTDEPLDVTSSGNAFTRTTIDDNIAGPAFVSTADVNNDGRTDLVVSAFGAMGFSIPNGTLTVYYQGEDLNSWEPEIIIDENDGVPFPNGTTLTDIDGDGDLDILSPSGFLVCTAIPFNPACGGIAWFEQTNDGWIRHTILENEQELFYHHAEVIDFDGDGMRDLIITGEQAAGFIGGANRAVAQWFKGTPSGSYFESEPRSMADGLGSFPRVRDVDGDGDLDIASAEYFHDGGSFAWLERLAEPSDAKPEGEFLRHVIADDVGPSIMFSFVPNFLGDGELKAIGSNHTNTAKAEPDPWESGIYLFDIPNDPREPWTKTLISEGIVSLPGNMISNQAAPGIFGAGDIDNDGDMDLAVSGDGDPRVFWIEQQAPGVFYTHVLAEGLGQAGGMIVEDLNQDGFAEVIVTSYESNVLHIFQHTMP